MIHLLYKGSVCFTKCEHTSAMMEHEFHDGTAYVCDLHGQGRTGSKKQLWIFSRIGPAQLQYKQSLYLTILQQACHIYGK